MSLVMQLLEVAPVNFPAQTETWLNDLLDYRPEKIKRKAERQLTRKQQKHLHRPKVNKAARNIKDLVTEEQHMEAAAAGVLQCPGRTPVDQRP